MMHPHTLKHFFSTIKLLLLSDQRSAPHQNSVVMRNGLAQPISHNSPEQTDTWINKQTLVLHRKHFKMNTGVWKRHTGEDQRPNNEACSQLLIVTALMLVFNAGFKFCAIVYVVLNVCRCFPHGCALTMLSWAFILGVCRDLFWFDGTLKTWLGCLLHLSLKYLTNRGLHI